MRIALLAPALFALILAAGCGGPSVGEVSGKVTYKNKPVPGGRLTFRPADGKHNAVTVELDESGNYPPVTLPVGDVAVIVDNEELAPVEDVGTLTPPGLKLPAEAKPAPAKGRGGASKKSSRYVKLPEDYRFAERTRLKFKVERGQQKKDLDLTD